MANTSKKDLLSPLAKARDDWFESEAGKDCLNASILAGPSGLIPLRNRLELAFHAGVVAGENLVQINLQKEHLQRLLDNARRAWPTHRREDDPPDVWNLVECLTNVACNRLKRIRELEQMVERLCELGKRV